MELFGDAIQPTRMRVRPGRRRLRYSRSQFVQLAADADLESLHVEGRAGWLLCVELERNGFWQVVVRLPEWPDGYEPDGRVMQDGFTAALLGDSRDKLEQSETAPANYEFRGRPLATERIVKDEYGNDVVDVSEHWGRGSIGPGMWFWAAARMWFGRPAFDVIDRDRLVQLDGVTELGDGIVRIDLFDPDWPIDKIRDRQRRFREQLDYDRLEVSRPDHLSAPSDPHMEIDKRAGTEQVERVVEWLDDDDQPQPRSRATRRRVTNFELDGTRTTWTEPKR